MTTTPPSTWEAQLLSSIGAPVTPSNVQALDLWAQSEGTLGSNNPLAISGSNPGATSCIAQCGSSSPIMAYDSLASGVAATARFLRGSYYTKVVQAFVADAGIGGIWAAINGSPWCSGCQGGKYPVALYQAASGQVPGVVGGAGASSTVNGQPTPNATADTCLVLWPGGGSIAGIGLPGGGCAFGTNTARAVLGSLLVVGGVTLGVVGVAVIVAGGLKGSKLAGSTARLAGAMPFGRDTYQATTKDRYSPADATSNAMDSDDRLHMERAERESADTKSSDEGRQVARDIRARKRATGPRKKAA